MQVDDGGKPFIAFPEETTFTFHLQLKNPDFALFTDLSDIAEESAPLYTNAGPNGDGSKVHLVSREAWFTESFIIEDRDSENRFILSGKPLAGLALDQFEVEVKNSGNVELKEYDETIKTITVDTHSAQIGEPFTVRYPISPRLKKGIFADVEIHNNGTLQPAEEEHTEFKIAFTARQAKWKYYLVTDLEGTAAMNWQKSFGDEGIVVKYSGTGAETPKVKITTGVSGDPVTFGIAASVLSINNVLGKTGTNVFTAWQTWVAEPNNPNGFDITINDDGSGNVDLTSDEGVELVKTEGTEEKFQLLDTQNNLKFTKNLDSSDNVAEELVEKYPDLQIIRFVSDNPIFCRQAARKHLKLSFENNCLFEALPNPSFRNLHGQDAFFKIVKYLTQLSP
jgi:hypothetical protein